MNLYFKMSQANLDHGHSQRVYVIDRKSKKGQSIFVDFKNLGCYWTLTEMKVEPASLQITRNEAIKLIGRKMFVQRVKEIAENLKNHPEAVQT